MLTSKVTINLWHKQKILNLPWKYFPIPTHHSPLSSPVKMSIAMLMILLACVTARPDTSDADSMSESDSSSTQDMDMDLDNNDPNLHNPQVGREILIITLRYVYMRGAFFHEITIFPNSQNLFYFPKFPSKFYILSAALAHHERAFRRIYWPLFVIERAGLWSWLRILSEWSEEYGASTRH